MLPSPYFYLPTESKPWMAGLCVHRRGRIYSGGSTRSRDAGAGAVRLPPGRRGGKGHSKLGRTPAGDGAGEGTMGTSGHQAKSEAQAMRNVASHQAGRAGSLSTAPTSCRPLLAHNKHTIGGPPGTEVSTLRPPISHTFSRSQSSCRRGKHRLREQSEHPHTYPDAAGFFVALRPMVPTLPCCTLKSTRTRCTPSGDFCFPVQPLGKAAKGPEAKPS